MFCPEDTLELSLQSVKKVLPLHTQQEPGTETTRGRKEILLLETPHRLAEGATNDRGMVLICK